MAFDQTIAKRPLPTLSEWIDQQSNGARGEGYDAFAALRDLAERTILQDGTGL
jgi:hypothetical protein